MDYIIQKFQLQFDILHDAELFTNIFSYLFF